MNICVWESVCERQEICKKEKALGIWIVDDVCAISMYVVVVASKVRYFIVLNTTLAIFSEFVQKNLFLYLIIPKLLLLRFKKLE